MIFCTSRGRKVHDDGDGHDSDDDDNDKIVAKMPVDDNITRPAKRRFWGESKKHPFPKLRVAWHLMVFHGAETRLT